MLKAVDRAMVIGPVRLLESVAAGRTLSASRVIRMRLRIVAAVRPAGLGAAHA